MPPNHRVMRIDPDWRIACQGCAKMYLVMHRVDAHGSKAFWCPACCPEESSYVA